jgi:mRNA interferase MazF
MLPQRGDIFYADINFTGIAIHNPIRPVLILDNQMGSRYKPTVICAAIVEMGEVKLPVHIALENEKYSLISGLVIRADFIQTIDKKRLREKLYKLDDDFLVKVNEALKISLGIQKL